MHIWTKKEPVNYSGKHEVVSQDLLVPSHLECGRALLLPSSDNKAEAVTVPGSWELYHVIQTEGVSTWSSF